MMAATSEMKDYHVLSLDDVENGEVTDHGVILALEDIPWAGRQLWDNDVVEKDGKYYLIYCAKDKNDVFHLGVAIAERPEGPFIPQPDPIRGSYSIARVCSAMMTDRFISISVVYGADNSNAIKTTRLCLQNICPKATKWHCLHAWFA